MKKLTAPYIVEKPLIGGPANLFPNLDRLERYSLDFAPWSSHPYKPNVHFSIAYSSCNIFLKYYVTEKFIKAANGSINAPVYDDTCVEFFISFHQEPDYYNFEFNCIGNSLVGFGNGKKGRQLLPEEVINKINYHVSISNTKDNLKYWELSVAIPYTVFCNHDITSLKGKECSVNFYKCGNMLKVPHFLTWSNIQSIEPDFHLRQFFGTLLFE